jgi:hypothetical protein
MTRARTTAQAKSRRRIRRAGTTLLVLTLLIGSPATDLLAATDAERVLERKTQEYRGALAWICYTGITPGIERLYEETVRAAEAAGYGAGRGGNFWGPRAPFHAYQDCLQGPGDRD